MTDNEGRLAFEINNMFRLNHRLCHGQIALYFPFFTRIWPVQSGPLIRKSVRNQEKLDNILKIDYSAYRDIHYRNPERVKRK